MWALINILFFFLSLFSFSFFYLLSLIPKYLERFWDKSAWDICSKFRAVAMVFEFICLGNIVLWWWFPVRSLSCSIFPSAWISLVIGAIILSIGGL
ncbi:MAG: hypothetical protein R6U96_10170, partial [Promethearchaeia archaeon]